MEFLETTQLEPVFDFAVNEQCHEYDECEAMRPFVGAGKPVFNAEYTDPRVNAFELALSIRTNAKQSGPRILLFPLGRYGSFRVSCDWLDTTAHAPQSAKGAGWTSETPIE